MSFLTRLRRRPAQEQPPAAVPGKHPVLARVLTVLAGLLVLLALVAPDRITRMSPGGFVRIPVEALLGVATVLVLPARPRRVAAATAGAMLGLLTVVAIVDTGFLAVLDRPFDLVLDWPLLGAGMDYLTHSSGRGSAVGALAGAVALAVAIPGLMTLSVLRLTGVVARHRTAAARTVAVLSVAWVVCAVLGAQIVPGVPVAARDEALLVYDHTRQVNASLRDSGEFAKESAVDAFRDTPGDQLLTGLRGKDVVLVFVESYGRSAVEDPDFAPQVGAVLDAGTRRLDAAGYASRSAFLTSPTVGGGSWLAHSTLLSGLWINNQQRYETFLHSDRLTLTRAFKQAGWRTVSVMPATTADWPEGRIYGHDKIYDARNLGYAGPPFTMNAEPDQYTLSVFQRTERAKPDRPPVMAEIPLISTHSPWTPVPRMLDWDDIGDGSVYDRMGGPAGGSRSPGGVHADYRTTIEYTLTTLISYVETYGDDDLVLIFLGDHQPAPVVTGEGASRDVPVTVVARDPAVLDRISGWGWQPGLRPGRQAPVWRMDAFRDRFLTAFGPDGHTGG